MSHGGFSRILPQFTKFLEKPFSRFSSGKIKKIYNGYEDFCKDIGVMLGENDIQPKTENHSNLDNYEKQCEEIQFSQEIIEKSQQLLGLSSHFFSAGLIIQDLEESSKVLSYFCESSVNHEVVLNKPFQTLSTFLNPENLLKPRVCTSNQILDRFNIPLKDTANSKAIIFCLEPDLKIFGIFITSLPGDDQLKLFLKTQGLIQKEFYG